MAVCGTCSPGPRRDRQREVIAHAIGPIWEANHVWLILAIVLAFTCFSPMFARIMTVLHIPVSLMLVGIVLRGSAFTFRTYDDEHDAAQRRWGRIFSSASLLTPVLLGVCIGAVASGRVVAPSQGGFAERFVEPWLTPFAFGVGMLTLALFAFLAAVFLTMEARDPDWWRTSDATRSVPVWPCFWPRDWSCCSRSGRRRS